MKRCRWCRMIFHEGRTAAGKRFQCPECYLPFITVDTKPAAKQYIRPNLQWRSLRPYPPPTGPLTKEELE